MISSEIQHFLKLADESHEAAKVLIDKGFIRFAAAQSYYTIFYLAQAMLLSKELTFSSHSALTAAYGKEFAKPASLIRNSTSIFLSLRNAARPGIMA